jgi:hypothetical protein
LPFALGGGTEPGEGAARALPARIADAHEAVFGRAVRGQLAATLVDGLFPVNSGVAPAQNHAFHGLGRLLAFERLDGPHEAAAGGSFDARQIVRLDAGCAHVVAPDLEQAAAGARLEER